MEKEYKEILLRDLCARLPYGVKCQHFDDKTPYALLGIDGDVLHIDCPVYDEGDGYVEIEYCKPYLRSLSSMTEEELKIYHSYCECDNGDFTGEILYFDTIESFDYLTSIHIDYRGLIPMGLAIEVTEKNNPYKE